MTSVVAGLVAVLSACGASTAAKSVPHASTNSNITTPKVVLTKASMPPAGIVVTATPKVYYKAAPASLVTKFETCTIVTPAQVAAVLHPYLAFSGAVTVKTGSSQGRHYCYYYVHSGTYAGKDVVSISATFYPITKFWPTGQLAQNYPATRPPGASAAWFDGEYLQLAYPRLSFGAGGTGETGLENQLGTKLSSLAAGIANLIAPTVTRCYTAGCP